MTREETLSTSPRAFILIDHPHAYREWTIVAVDSVPGFYHLEFSIRRSFRNHDLPTLPSRERI